MISIDTKRLHLRNVLQNDVDVIFDYRNNEICARYQRGQVKDYEGIVSLIERRRNDEISIDFPCMIAVALKDTNEMIGEIVVMPRIIHFLSDIPFLINIIDKDMLLKP